MCEYVAEPSSRASTHVASSSDGECSEGMQRDAISVCRCRQVERSARTVEREFTKKQLEAAMRVGDHARAVRVADKLGEIKFRDSSYRDRHELKKCPLLKSPERFCKRLWGLLSFESLSRSMLHWVPSPIHTYTSCGGAASRSS